MSESPGPSVDSRTVPIIVTTDVDVDANERQPLVDPSINKPPAYVDVETQEVVDDQEIEEGVDPAKIDEPEPWSTWAIVFYAALSFLCVFLLVIFIKGFIEADDVDVRLPSYYKNRQLI